IGFFAVPGNVLNAFVGGVYQGEVSTNWKIDGASAYELSGGADDYFGWHQFSGVVVKMLIEISRGRQLNIQSSASNLSVELNGSRVALSKFVECYMSKEDGTPKKIPYGFQTGMEVDVIGATGIDTDLAEITVQHTK